MAAGGVARASSELVAEEVGVVQEHRLAVGHVPEQHGVGAVLTHALQALAAARGFAHKGDPHA